MATDTFTCTRCGGTFPKAWSDKEALEESRSIFGFVDSADLTIVCDDCFKEMGLHVR